MNTLTKAARDVLDACENIDFDRLVPDYSSGHYTISREDGIDLKRALHDLRAALAKEVGLSIFATGTLRDW